MALVRNEPRAEAEADDEAVVVAEVVAEADDEAMVEVEAEVDDEAVVEGDAGGAGIRICMY